MVLPSTRSQPPIRARRRRVLPLAAVFVLLVATGCGADTAVEVASSSGTGAPADEPMASVDTGPPGAMWILESDSLTLHRVRDVESPAPTTERPGLVYQRDDGVTARIVSSPEMVEPGRDREGGPSRAEPLGQTGAVVILHFGDTSGATLTISGATDPHAATEAADGLAALIGDGRELAFDTGDDTARTLGSFRYVGGVDGSSPVIDSTTTELEYRTREGYDVLLTQAQLVDSDMPLDVAALPAVTPTEDLDGLPIIVSPAGTGVPPVLVTIAGTSRVTITSPGVTEDGLRELARSLRPVEPSTLDEMRAEVEAVVAPQGDGEDIADGITLYQTDDAPIACIDGRDPHQCGEALTVYPITVVPIVDDDGYLLVGCVVDPPGVREVVVAGDTITTEVRPCGASFSAAGLATGPVRLEVPDAEGVLVRFDYELPAIG